MTDYYKAPSRALPKTHQRGEDKVSRIPIKVVTAKTRLPKPAWIRTKMPTGKKIQHIKKILREHQLSSVCEEAQCPNLAECFQQGTATFMIMGDICTRRCPFCDVAHGKPLPLNAKEPIELAQAIQTMQLRYVVVTSVDRDDLRDGGASHFADCIHAIRTHSPRIKIEVLVPDFRGRHNKALLALEQDEPDVFNHNLESVPRIYKKIRPGADYQISLDLIQNYKEQHPQVATKSGLMVGLGETDEEIEAVMVDLRSHACEMLTLGQYLQPSLAHLSVERYVSPQQFEQWRILGEKMGFKNVASGPMVRSSYHADLQANPLLSM